MSNDQPARRPPAKSGGGGAPMGSTISIVVAVVAVIVGFLILRNINDDGASGGPTGDVPTSSPLDTTALDPTSTSAPTTTAAPTTAAPDTSQTVVVANAAGVDGAAGQMSTALAGVGFTMGTASTATGVEARLPISKVYYVPGGEGTAASVAAQFGGIQATAMPATVPIEGGAEALGGATVLLMLGQDFGGKPLPALSADGGSTTLPATPLDTTTTLAG